MGFRRRAGLAAVTLAAGAIAVALLGFVSVDDAHAGWFLPERRLTWNTATQTFPDISGTRVAYSDYRNRRRVGGVWVHDTYVLDLKTMKARRLTPGHYAKAGPAIDGYRVVWGEVARSGVKEAVVYRNLRTGSQQRIRTRKGGHDVDISGKRVVYVSTPHTHGDEYPRVYLYDLSTRNAKKLGVDGAGSPAISGSRVAWHYGDEDQCVGVRDLATGLEKVVEDWDRWSGPAISGRHVVWRSNTRSPEYRYCLRLYDAITGTESVVATDMGTWGSPWTVLGDPAISGNLVVWADTRNGHSEIYLYDLASKIEKRVTSGTSNKTQPTISGDRIVYVDDRAGANNLDLYMVRLATPTVTLSGPAAVHYDTSARLKGALRSAGGSLLASRTVTLQVSTNARDWVSRATASTDASGAYWFDSQPLVSGRYFRVRFAGDSDCPPGVSPALRIRPRVLFDGAPRLGTYDLRAGRSYAIWGHLTPFHSNAGVKLRAYRYQKRSDGTRAWVYRRTFTASAWSAVPPTSLKYRARIELPSKGAWRLRAYHPADTCFATTFSDLSYVTVR